MEFGRFWLGNSTPAPRPAWISKVDIVDFSAASNSSLTQQANQDNRTEILSLKDLNNSNECIDDELVPDDAVYQAPFGPSAGDKEENVSPADLEMQLVYQTRELRHELLKEIHDDRTKTLIMPRSEKGVIM